MLTLYQRTDCPFCWKVRIALAELGLEYQIVDLVFAQKHPDVSRLSPTGSVPVLVDGTVAIWESGVILEYLEDRYGYGKMFPGEPAEQAQIRLLHAYSDKLVGACLRELVFEKRSKLASQWDRGFIESCEDKWRACLQELEVFLGDKPFFGGEFFCAADCALAARCGVAAAYGANFTTEFPSIGRWYNTVSHRPSWQAAYPASFIRTE